MTYSRVVQEERVEVFNETTNVTEEIVAVEYAPAFIKLAWIGFQDPHNDIDHYIITVGSSYRGTDFHEVRLIYGNLSTLFLYSVVLFIDS